jgi:hypothetical protein
MLNISRSSLIQLLDDGKSNTARSEHTVESGLKGLMKYKRNAEASRRAALEELAAYDRELGI